MTSIITLTIWYLRINCKFQVSGVHEFCFLSFHIWLIKMGWMGLIWFELIWFDLIWFDLIWWMIMSKINAEKCWAHWYSTHMQWSIKACQTISPRDCGMRTRELQFPVLFPLIIPIHALPCVKMQCVIYFLTLCLFYT